MPAPPEGYPKRVTDVYPGIAPEKFKGTHTGKVVFITGGGTGLGLAAAKAFAQTGAKLFLVGRRLPQLEEAKAEVEKLGAEVGIATVDVTNEQSTRAGVTAAVKLFGKLDIVIANAGRDSETDKKIADFSAENWWSCIEASVKGSFLTAHETIPELIKTKGYIILLSSILAQIRFPGGSAYNIAKHSLNRLAEWIDIDYKDQGVKAFAIHPGGVATALSDTLANTTFKGVPVFTDNENLSAWTFVRLTSGSEDWLSGRYFDSTWDVDEISKLKDKVVEQDALKNRLALPVL